MKNSDPFTNSLCQKTAKDFQKLASLRGVSSFIEWKENQYFANGKPLGTSVHCLYDWLNSQPGVKP